MAFKMKPLNQEEYTMIIVEDLGMLQGSKTRKYRYAMFECTKCNVPFKARCGGKASKAQTTCIECTKSSGTVYHPLYAIWNGIRQRCYNPKRKDYNRYGAIGVTMCKEWKDDVEAFYTWCIANGWKQGLVVDKDIKCRKLGITPAIYSPNTVSIITNIENTTEATGKQVAQYTLDGELVTTYNSAAEAARVLGKPSSAKANISKVCRNEAKSSLGFKWKYI